MNVTLEAIKFNHDPSSATWDAFNIRRNETEPVPVPEWRRGVSIKPEDSPAAYARNSTKGKTLTIRAKFTCSDSKIATLMIRALDGYHDLLPVARANVLGEVSPKDVVFTQGESDFELFELIKVRIQDVAVSISDIIWRWQFRTESTDWTDFANTTHRIYSVLALPRAPWQPEFYNDLTQQPWTAVLDFACRWAESAQTLPEAATLVTRRVNELGKGLIHYDNPQSGLTGFTIDSPPSFDCSDFLLLLRGLPNMQGSAVNCDDCATIVASFSNILGCELSEAKMDRDFPLHPHLRIGNLAPQSDTFSYHSVAWAKDCTEDDEVFDACMQLDSDDKPADEPHPWFVPANMRFGRLHESLYRFRLTTIQDQCNPVQGTKLNRRIGFPKLKWEMLSPGTFAPTGKSPDAKLRSAIRDVSLLVSAVLSPEIGISPWRLRDIGFINDPNSVLSTQLFLRGRDDADVAIRIEADVAATRSKAIDKVAEYLSRFQLKDIKQQEDPEFGEVAHTVPGKLVIVFSRREFAFRLRNVGRKLVSCADLARAIDGLLMSQLPSQLGDKEET